ncbi:MAG: DUF6089 family protein [Candidatus Azobacteroides sp.]|nr:DUF6089 family protein [Candidatus Azobacteroides sp.]
MVFSGIKKIQTTGLLLFFPLSFLFAQSYRYEIGGMLGTSFYLGEANRSMYHGIRETFGGVFRYNYNFRYAVKANLAMAGITGDTQGYPNVFPGNTQVSFSRNLFDLGVQIEFNFFNYSDEFKYLDTQRWSPYVSAGVGMTFSPSPGDNGSFFGMNIPFGVGIKYKIKHRWNVGLEFSFRKTLQDNLDVTSKNPDFSLDDPYGIKSSTFKNKDWYNFTFIFVTYDFYTCGGFCR